MACDESSTRIFTGSTRTSKQIGVSRHLLARSGAAIYYPFMRELNIVLILRLQNPHFGRPKCIGACFARYMDARFQTCLHICQFKNKR